MIEIFKKLFKDPASETDHQFYRLVTDIIREIKKSKQSNYFSVYDVKFGELSEYKKLKTANTAYKKKFVNWLVKDIVRIGKRNSGMRTYPKKYENDAFLVEQELLPLLFRSNLDLTEEEFMYYLSYFKKNKFHQRNDLSYWPIGFLVQQLDRHVKKSGCSDTLKKYLNEMITWSELDAGKSYYGSDLGKVKRRIEEILFSVSGQEGAINPFSFRKDEFGQYANTQLAKSSDSLQKVLHPVLHNCIKISGSKPTKKFLKQTDELLSKENYKVYKEFIASLCEKVIDLDPVRKTQSYTYQNEEQFYYTYQFIDASNLNTLKGLVWTMVKFHDSKSLALLSKLTEKCFKKIPGEGPTAAALGNACIYVLANTKGTEGIGHLTVLKQRIKQTSTKKLIEKYIVELSNKLGMSKSDIEQTVVPEFGLENGYKIVVFDDYNFEIKIERIGKVANAWIKPDGKIQKSIPAFVKSNKSLSNRLKKSKAEIKEIQKFVTSQRDRLDDLFIEEKEISYEAFYQYYFNHGLVSFIARKLIWRISKKEKSVDAIWIENKWVDQYNKEVDFIDNNCTFQLWHPIYAETDEVLRWRQLLIDHQIVQPLKQAFREIYILTPAEVNTKTYSNRMASHIVKQHQFNTLAKLRNWQYQLIGAWDHGSDCIARKHLDKWNLTAEYWTNEIYDDGQINDAGILLYMSTDQVRFTKGEEPLDLIDVPKIVFSEIMRDVDLFVGVCSVGNDPEWQDNGGLPQYRDYWQSYSFGDLTEVAKTRKTILENLVPRLKIKDVSTIEGRFLRVKGKLRTYKIHIGSTNILMEPNDQYLCIVPSGVKNTTDKLYLPFEGDRGLSVILSKAFLLAEDDTIIDPTITRQIKK
ncbi:DUF4132 domain-containing protein [Spongiivirga sp. MCCC 1A20706]|uniref:DUF4132 domain-containing protein n=1 Tax=Spongiivirga sp. MCCC 1A20706 TaxID=3160963 RepID=UPI003977E123